MVKMKTSLGKFEPQGGSVNSIDYSLNMTQAVKGRRSRRLGMSQVGGKCVRSMWFKFRWAREGGVNKRVKRIFDAGNAFEDMMIKSLEEIGITIERQQEGVAGWGGHIYGFIDGVATNVPGAEKTEHLFEAKSANDRIFKTIKKNGVKKAKHEHYVQMTNYMGKLGLTRALYAVINKNDCEIYTERIYFEEGDYREYMSTAIDVVSHETPPPNLINDESNRTCKWCDFVPLCYQGESLEENCRTCANVDIEDEGKWSCSIDERTLTFEEQEAGCGKYRQIVE